MSNLYLILKCKINIMKYQICPFCKKEFLSNNGKHPYICAKKDNLNLSKDEIRFELIKTNFSKLADKDFLQNIYINENYSLNKIVKIYDINRKQLENLLIFYGFHLKGYSEGALSSMEDKKKTNILKYGVENPSQIEEIKDKKRKTFLKNYGVDNIRKSKDFYTYINNKIIEKYGITREELASIKSKEVWLLKTEEEKDIWLANSIHKQRKSSHQGIITSKAENKIASLCIELGLNIETSFTIYYNKRNRFVYDILLKDYNIIIEYNGDLYHANPIIYKETDILKFPIERTAKEIWIKDDIKNQFAKKYGYTVIFLWEKEFNENKFHLREWLLNKLKENGLQIT